jgi:hypothetical protein
MRAMKHALRTILFALALTACGQPQPQPEPEAAAPDPAAEARTNADFGLRLALIEGHMLIGKELLDAGQTQNAIPHFGHPVRELYSDMLPVIVRRQGQTFDRDLVALEGMAAAGPSPAFTAAFDAALAKVRAQWALIPDDVRQSDDYVLHLTANAVTTSAQEYRNAVVAGRIDSLIEYHDTRGFLFYLTDMLAAHQGGDPRLPQAAAIVATLRQAVEPLNPPNPPRMTPEQFEEQATALRTLVGASAEAGAPAPMPMEH